MRFKIKQKKTRTTSRQRNIQLGKFLYVKPKVGYHQFYAIPLSKFKSRSFLKRWCKPIVPYASWYKIFGYKDLDELYQVIGYGKHREVL